MNGHVSEWIPAYYDGELSGRRLQQVEAHLSRCPECQSELAAMGELTFLLQSAPVPASQVSAGRFASQVALRLTPAPLRPAWTRPLKLAWLLTPLGIITGWAFAQAALLLAGLLMSTGLQDISLPAPRVGALTGFAWPALSLFRWTGLVQEFIPSLSQEAAVLELLGLDLLVTVTAAVLLTGWVVTFWKAQRSLAFQ